MQRSFPDDQWDRFALAALVVGALIRAVWVLVLHPPWDHVYSDMGGYVERARDLVSGDPLDRYDAFYPPGTHLLLAVPLFVAGTGSTGLWLGAYLWWALASLIPFFVWRLARSLLTRSAAAIGAALVALYPLHISYAGYFLSEIPATAFLTACLWLGTSAQGHGSRSATVLAAVGALGGLALVNRPQFLFNLVVLGAGLLPALGLRPRRLVPLALGLAMPIAIALGHNAIAAGRVVGLNENGGITFYVGHCQVRRVALGSPATFYISPPPQLQKGGREEHFPEARPWDQSFFYARAFDCIRADGLGHLRLVAASLVDMGATTVPWPQVEQPSHRLPADLVNALYTVALLPIVALSIAVRGRRRACGQPSGELTLLAHLAMVVPLAVLVFGDPRFRMPYDVFGLALAGSIVAWVCFDRPRPGSAGVRPDVLRAEGRRAATGRLEEPLDVRDVEADER